MDFSQFLGSLQGTLGDSTPKILGAIAILIIGWLAAVIIRMVIRKGLGAVGLNEKIAGSTDSKMDIESGVAAGGFWLVIVMALVAVFNALDLTVVSGPLEGLANKVFDFIPQLAAGGALIFVAWLIATIVRMLVTKVLGATSIDDKLSAEAGMRPMSKSAGDILYWLVFLVFLPAILGAFNMQGLLEPVQDMVNKMLNMLPNIFGAAVIGFVGWFVAKILRDLVSNLLTAVGADKLGETAGLKGTMTLSKLLGMIVFIFVFVPALIAALNALQIDVISEPATEMLGMMMAAIPNIFAAAIILATAFFVSRFIANILSNLLGGVGFDNLPAKLGLGDQATGSITPSNLVGKIVVFFIMLFASVEAAGRLGFTKVSDLVGTFIQFGGQVLLGTVILAVGFWLSNLAHTTILRVSGKSASAVAGIARFAILGLVAAMGLRAMGIADDIVNIAFTLILGAIAVAIALSFGLGGREAAGKQMEYWLEKMRK